ncbi:hypothetical protein, partial [Vibrio harveyi]|uniref:hypothetical protein n=1 Tax=Vibrio harveyi TaxID=669 RepID=UPI001E34AF6D
YLHTFRKTSVCTVNLNGKRIRNAGLIAGIFVSEIAIPKTALKAISCSYGHSQYQRKGAAYD